MYKRTQNILENNLFSYWLDTTKWQDIRALGPAGVVDPVAHPGAELLPSVHR